MRAILFALTPILVAASAPPPQAKAPESHCAKVAMHPSDAQPPQITPRRLGDEPPANLYRAVYRTVNGCMEPIIVRQRILGR